MRLYNLSIPQTDVVNERLAKKSELPSENWIFENKVEVDLAEKQEKGAELILFSQPLCFSYLLFLVTVVMVAEFTVILYFTCEIV